MPSNSHVLTSNYAEMVSEELAERMMRLKQAIRGHPKPTRSSEDKPKSVAVNPQPEHPEKQEEQDASSNI